MWKMNGLDFAHLKSPMAYSDDFNGTNNIFKEEMGLLR
jgi:hypothetical protein